MIPIKMDCNVSRATVENAFGNYNKEIQTDVVRIAGIDLTVQNGLWKLWILALMYQAMHEETSEKIFHGIPGGGLTFNPSLISRKALDCGCKFLQTANKVHFCDFKSGSCSQDQFIGCCPLPEINEEIHRLPRISKEVLASAIFLRHHDFEFRKLYESLHCVTTSERTEKILEIFMILAGEKISHLYLGWVANPDLVRDYWDLDSERLLAIDVNIKRVSHNIGLCAWSNTSVIRAHLHQLLDELGMDNSKDAKKLEMAFLYVGQQYCKGNRQTQCKQTECPFYPARA
jgi:hypothetical protein